MHGAAAPVAAADLGQAWAAGVMEAWRPVTERVRAQVLAAVVDPALWALPGLTVSREALGLEPSAAYLLGEHMRRVHDALNDQENRLLERAFLPPGLRRPEPGADCG